MATYTTELYNALLSTMPYEDRIKYNPLSLTDMSAIIQSSIPSMFFYFPIWDDGYRNVLCTKILTHYYFNEIGFDTSALFMLRLNNKLNEIMPYYVQLYKTQVHDLELLAGIDLYEDFTGVTDKDESKDKHQVSDTDRDDNTTRTSDQTINGKVTDSGTQTTDTSHSQTRSPELTTTVAGVGEKHTEGNNTSAKDQQTNSSGSTTEEGSLTETDSMTNNLTDTTTYDSNTTRTGNTTDSDTGKDITKNRGYDDAEKTGKDIVKDIGDDSQKFSDTPQGGLSLALANDNFYLTNFTKNEHDNTNTTTYDNNLKTTYNSDTELDYGKTKTITYNQVKDTKAGDDTLRKTGTQTNEKTGSGNTSTTSEGNTNTTSSVKDTKTADETSSNNQTTDLTGRDTTSGTASVGLEKHFSKLTDSTVGLTDTSDYVSNILNKLIADETLAMQENKIHTLHKHGWNNPNMVDVIAKWRDLLINIDMMIIQDLRTLFMMIY